MGHSSIGDTACYLRLIAGSCPQIAARVQHELGGIVPPATEGPCHGDSLRGLLVASNSHRARSEMSTG
jgi:hypothetical protein